MQNALQHELRKKVKPLVLPLYRVHDGTKCTHTGTRYAKGGVMPSKLGEGDRGLVFTKTSNHEQRLSNGESVIFGLNDLVEVIQS